MPTITIHDESTTGRPTSTFTLDLFTESLTLRELIRSRVYQEVDDFNRRQAANPSAHFQGLPQPAYPCMATQSRSATPHRTN